MLQGDLCLWLMGNAPTVGAETRGNKPWTHVQRVLASKGSQTGHLKFQQPLNNEKQPGPNQIPERNAHR